MRLERNRAERRSKKGAQIMYNGIPYLIFAALAAGFLLGTPQAQAVSAIVQSDRTTATYARRFPLGFMMIGNIGKTNSVLSTAFTEDDFTYTGSYTWVDDEDGDFRIRLLSSGAFTPQKDIVIDVFLVGGGGSGRRSSEYGGGSGGGYAGTHTSVALAAGTPYLITVAATQTSENSVGNSTTAFGYTLTGGNPGVVPGGGNGGSGGGTGGTVDANRGAGGYNGGNGYGSAGGTGQGTTTYEFGDSSLALYSGGGGGAYRAGGAGGGGNGYNYDGTHTTEAMSAADNTGGGAGGSYGTISNYGYGGSGIVIIRNARAA